MSWHLVVHYLDDLRHYLAFTWVWQTWIGNVSAGVVIGAFMSLFYPPVRTRFKGWIERHFGSVHAKLDYQHREHINLAKAQYAKSDKEAERRHLEALELARTHHQALKDHVSETLNGKKPGGRDARGRFAPKEKT